MFRKFFILSIILTAICLFLAGCDIKTLFAEPIDTATPEPTPTELPEYTIGSTQTSSIDGMVMVYVPAGDFLMGSIDETMGNGYESPQHTV